MAAQDKWPALGTPKEEAPARPAKESKAVQAACPTCGSALRLYVPQTDPPYTHPYKKDTGFCDACGVRHKVKAAAKDD
jgi:C4-type Zn-finger protein